MLRAYCPDGKPGFWPTCWPAAVHTTLNSTDIAPQQATMRAPRGVRSRLQAARSAACPSRGDLPPSHSLMGLTVPVLPRGILLILNTGTECHDILPHLEVARISRFAPVRRSSRRKSIPGCPAGTESNHSTPPPDHTGAHTRHLLPSREVHAGSGPQVYAVHDAPLPSVRESYPLRAFHHDTFFC